MNITRATVRFLFAAALAATLLSGSDINAQTSGQFRLFILPFKISDVHRKDVAKFHETLRLSLKESGRYELVEEEELKEALRSIGLNVRKPVPDSMAVTIAKLLSTRIMLKGSLETTQEGTVRADAMMLDVYTGTEKKIGNTQISVGTDISVLSGNLVDLIYRRADVDKYMNFGTDYLRSHIFERAIENFGRVLELDSTVVAAYYYLGNAHMEIQDTTEAIGFYERTVKMDSTYDQAIFRLGSLYLNRSEYDKAVSLFMGLMKVDPDNYTYYLYAGIAYHRAGRLDEALEMYQKGHELNPDEHLFSENMGKIYYQREEYALAAERLEEVSRLQDGDVDILQILSACYSQLSDYEKAAATDERIVAIDPAFPNGYKNLGIWYGKLKQYDKAIDALSKGIESSPENERSEIYLSLVDIYLKAGNYRKVIEVGKSALSYKPNIRIYVFLGDAYQAMGEALEKENTSASFEKAIEDYKSSTTNYNRIVKDAKYGKYARQSIQRNDDLIDRAELIIKKLRLEEG